MGRCPIISELRYRIKLNRDFAIVGDFHPDYVQREPQKIAQAIKERLEGTGKLVDITLTEVAGH
jgi:hypothetical protein